jgi:hypothetical protein
MALRCVDSLLKYSQNNFQGDYAAGPDNAANIAYVFYRYGHEQALDEFVAGYCQKKKIDTEEFYLRLTGRCVRERATAAALDLYFWMNIKLNLNLRYASREDLGFFFRKYRSAIDASKGSDHLHYYTAISYKHEAILKGLLALPGGAADTGMQRLFDQAMAEFKLVSPAYLQQQIRVNGNSASEEMVASRRYMFIYPDLRLEFHPLEPRAFLQYYMTDHFMDYVMRAGHFDALYASREDLESIADWFYGYNVKMFVPFSFLAKPIRMEVLESLASNIERRSMQHMQDLNLLYLDLGYRAQQAGDTARMLAAYRTLVPSNFLNILRYKEYGNNVNDRSFRLMAFAVKGFSQAGHFDEAYRLLSAFKKASNRSSLYAFAAAEMLVEGSEAPIAGALIDSARKELSRTTNVQGAQLNRQVLAYALALQDPVKNQAEIAGLIKNLPQKLIPNRNTSRALAFRDRLYEAYNLAPGLLSDDDRAGNIWMILYGYGLKHPVESADWRTYNDNYLQLTTRNINYEDESS